VIKVVHTACPLDCPDTCSIAATVEDGRVVSLDGDDRNPYTAGFICAKVRRLPRHVYGAQRVLHPAIRVGGTLRRASWDEALDLVATRLAEIRDRHGGEAILPFAYGGSNGALTDGTVDLRLFRRLGASELDRTACAMPTSVAAEGLYRKRPGVDLRDYIHAKLIVMWGMNPSASGIHHVPILKEAQRRGATLVVVDPRRIPVAKTADVHLAPRPGTDLVLALAVIRWLFEQGRADDAFLAQRATGVEQLRERAAPWDIPRAAAECGLPADAIESFARTFADASPAVIRCGWGIERNRNGGSACAAILALPAVAGKFGVRGGGYTMSNAKVFELDTEAIVNEPMPDVRHINMAQLGPVLTGDLDPPVHALFVYNCNPVMTMPDQQRVRQGLRRDDLFTVVFDQVMTDTADYADVVLPATTFVEHHDLKKSYGAPVLARIRPIVAPVGEARPNYAVFAELVERLGLRREGDLVDPDAIAAALCEDREDVTVRAPAPVVDPERIDLFPWPHLYTYKPDPSTRAYPLSLISPATSRTISSTFGQLVPGLAQLVIHPEDARQRGIADGTTVRVFNDLGEVVCPVRLSDAVRPGVVELPKGLWSRHTLNGNTANALAPTTLADLGGGAAYNDARVDVAPAAV
jgi:anaerobic selenocysteine-containing dehydrogenase